MRFMRVSTFGVLSFLGCIAAESAATTIHVPADHPTIGIALSVAVSGDTVLVACGTYSETGLALQQGVTLLGDSADSSCVVIQGSVSPTPILTMAPGNATFTVRWLTFRNGQTTAFGGAISSSSSLGSRLISNCRFEGNSAFNGGAVYLSGHVENCEFVDNRATQFGGGFCAAPSGPMIVDACSFRRNRANVSGGGLYSNRGDVGHCVFEQNFSQTEGGGLFIKDGTPSVVHDCVFRQDSTFTHGGGAGCSGSGNFSACVFEDNYAKFDGGGLWAYSGFITSNCRFIRNVAGRRGGGYSSFSPPASLRSCTLFGNKAAKGGGVAAEFGSLRIERCVIQGSLAGAATSFEPTALAPDVDCSDFYGNAGGDWTTLTLPFLGVSGNFSADALFCNASAGVVTVSSSSPLLAQNNECSATIGSEVQACDTPGIVVTTMPPGLPLTVDGVATIGPTVYDWSAGSGHTIGTVALYTPLTGVRHEFQSWSDEGDVTHFVTAPSSPGVFAATFAKTYFLTMESDSGGSVTPATGWVPARQIFTITQTPDSAYSTQGWTGSGIGSYTGSNPAVSLTMRAPITESGHFRFEGMYPLTMIAVGGGTVLPSSGDYYARSVVPIRATSPPGYVFTGWVGQGNGSYTGPDPVTSVTMLAPITQTANFEYWGFFPLTMQTVGSGTVTPSSGDYPALATPVISASAAPGFMFYRWVGEGVGSYTGQDWSAHVTMNEALTQTAFFAEGGNFPLTMSASSGGTAFPSSGSQPMGSPVAIGVLPLSGWRFKEWQGSGYGSYSGTDAAPTITMQGPIQQHAVFEPDGLAHGYEFAISASATDPMENTSPPTGGARPLFLWLVCGDGGLSAFESGVSSTFPPGPFFPADGVFNVGSGTDLLLAVGGCPGNSGEPTLLGTWYVDDHGGRICLGPSESGGLVGAVDCGTQPSFWADPRVHGFSSSDLPPCVVGANPCGTIGPVSIVLSQIDAKVGDRCVRVSWATSAEVHHLGFYVYRRELGNDVDRRLNSELLVGRSPYELSDASVESDHTYFYRIGAVDDAGAEVLYGPVSATTPKWPPLVTALSSVSPNPFRGTTRVSFSLASPGHARLSIYDVAGRLVGTIRDQNLPAGEHVIEWDGRSNGGRAAAGVYFLRFEAGEHRQTKRVVLLGSTH